MKFPLYQIPPGMPWTMLIAGAACALLGLATAWSDSPLVGILWVSIIGTVIFDSYAAANLINDKVPLSWMFGILFMILLPMTAMTAVVIGIFRLEQRPDQPLRHSAPYQHRWERIDRDRSL